MKMNSLKRQAKDLNKWLTIGESEDQEQYTVEAFAPEGYNFDGPHSLGVTIDKRKTSKGWARQKLLEKIKDALPLKPCDPDCWCQEEPEWDLWSQ